MRDNSIRSRRKGRTAQHVVLVLGILVSSAVTALAQGKAPVPDDASRAKARELVRQVFGAEYDRAKTSSEKAAVARKMLDEAGKARADPASHFAILSVARDVAVEAGEAETALEAVDEIARTYQVDGAAMQVETLLAASENAGVSEQQKAVVRAAIPLIQAAVAEDDYETANRLLAPKVLNLALRSRDAAFVKRTLAIKKEVEESEKAYHEAKAARAVLENNPADPDANLTVGRYLCLCKRDWDKGVAMLALGSDAQLKALAEKELEGAASADEQVALGDGWWGLAQVEEGDVRESMTLRAGSWYRAAQEEVSGLIKMKIDGRLEEIASIGTVELPKSYRQRIFTFDDAAFAARYWVWSGEWTMGDDGAQALNSPKSFLRTLHAYSGDLAIDVDFSLGRARFRNTGDCWVTVWGKMLVISKTWQRLDAQIHIHREGDEIVFILNGQEQRVPVEPKVWSKPTAIEIRWRSRTSHFRRIEINARSAVAVN